jgi:hypothetical protein
LVPPLPFLTRRFDIPEQQEQPAPWPDPDAPDVESERGALALRSFVAWAARVLAESVEQCGAVRITRGAIVAQSGHSNGSALSAIGRICVNEPQRSHRYS